MLVTETLQKLKTLFHTGLVIGILCATPLMKVKAAPGEPLIISITSAPTITGTGVGQVVIFEDAGWLDTNDDQIKDVAETSVDLRGEVTQITGSPMPDFQMTGDDFRVRLDGIGEVSVRWQIYEAVAGTGNGATGTLGIGSPNILVKDIDGPNIEHVGSNLNNLKSYSVEAGPPASDLISSTATAPFIIFSGTASHTSTDTESMAKFSWEDVDNFEIFYEAESGGRVFDHDGDGDITFTNENVVDLPPSVTNGSSYINDANKAAYNVLGTCTAAGDDITINLSDGSTTIGPLLTACDAGGNFSVTTDVSTLNDGNVTITTQIDDGVNAVVTDIDTVVKDTVPPVVPPAVAPDLTNATDSGNDNQDDVTNIVNPSFVLSCVSGNTVNLLVNGTAAGTGTCTDGSATVTSTQNLNEGTNTISFTETDPYENESTASPSLSVTLETVASAAPTVTAPTAGITVPDTITVSGSCVVGDTVNVGNAHLVLNPTTVACADGTYSVEVNFTPAANGNAEILSVTQTDYVGNESSATTVSVNVDSQAPGNGTTNALLTNDNRPALTGALTAPTAATDTVQIEINGQTYPAVNNGNGTWSLADNTVTALPDGIYDVTLTLTDAVGNQVVTTDNNIIEIDTVVPSAPTVDSPNHNAEVSTLTPTISGSGSVSGDTILVTGPEGETCTTTVGLTGAWTCVMAPALAEGGPQNLTVTATDPAGNVSASVMVTITTDTTNPTPPTVNSPTHGGLDNDTTPVFNGTGEVGTTVVVTNGAGNTCTTTVQPDNSWSCEVSPALSVGTLHSFVITQTDTAGNVSSDTALNLTIDITPPNVTLARATGQSAVTPTDEAEFTLTFDKPINPATLVASDLNLTGSTGSVTTGPTEIAPLDGTTFAFTITGLTDGTTVTVTLPAGTVRDLAGNLNTLSTGAANTIEFDTTLDTDGDGLSDLIELQLGTNPAESDSDSDGTSDDNNDLDNIHPSIELAAPNGGDANGDGLLDAVQSSVSSLPNTRNGFYNSLQTANAGVTHCGQIQRFNSLNETDLSAEDSADDYPLGLWDFQILCDNPGDTAQVIIFLDKLYDASNWKYKKFNSVTNQYSDISGSITYGQATVGATLVTTISYSITDGGPLDADGLANGIIEDPAGPSMPFVSPSSTTSNRTGGTATAGRGRYAGQTRAEYQASQQYGGEVTKHNFEEAYAFSKDQIAKLNKGHEAKVLTYTDSYGREKFAGYQPGRLAKGEAGEDEVVQVIWRTDRKRADIETVLDQRKGQTEKLLAAAPNRNFKATQTPVGSTTSAKQRHWFQKSPDNFVTKRLDSLYQFTFGRMNLDKLLGSAPEKPKKLKRTTDVNTIINRRKQGLQKDKLEEVLRERFDFEYADPNNPGWLPANKTSGRDAIKGKDQTLIKFDYTPPKIERR